VNTLGIYDGHLSTAALMVDGHLTAMISEERLTRQKNQGGPPERAIGWVLERAGIRGDDVNAVALAMITEPLTHWGEDLAQVRRKIFRAANALLPGTLVGSRLLLKPYIFIYKYKRDWKGLNTALSRHGVSPALYKTNRVEHHTAHAAGAYLFAPFREHERPVLIVTADNSGDGISATVSIGHRGEIRRIHWIVSFHSIGELYIRVTELLGMRALEDEFKVMGLAPYAPPALADRAYEVFNRFFRSRAGGLTFRNVSGKWGPALRAALHKQLEGVRFDAVAAGVQRLVEQVVGDFVLAWARKTGVSDVAVGGGVFMNVKLNMLLSRSPEINRIFFMPSAGDESLAAGAAALIYARRCLAQGREVDIEPLTHLFWGPDYSDADIRDALVPFADRLTWCEHDDIDSYVATRLADGDIVGRLAGRMEWGARSLGNRAILADPRQLWNVRRINLAIKKRDFWMPFAPSLMEEYSDEYLDNPRKLDAPFMINAFPATERAQRDLPCGLHQFDLTCRPQIVKRCENPRYHRLLYEFHRITGVGGVLNTSFNLHGEPIVCSPADAIHTLLSSDLDGVALERFYVRKRHPESHV
jgi:carbamoyltransferase